MCFVKERIKWVLPPGVQSAEDVASESDDERRPRSHRHAGRRDSDDDSDVRLCCLCVLMSAVAMNSSEHAWVMVQCSLMPSSLPQQHVYTTLTPTAGLSLPLDSLESELVFQQLTSALSAGL